LFPVPVNIAFTLGICIASRQEKGIEGCAHLAFSNFASAAGNIYRPTTRGYIRRLSVQLLAGGRLPPIDHSHSTLTHTLTHTDSSLTFTADKADCLQSCFSIRRPPEPPPGSLTYLSTSRCSLRHPTLRITTLQQWLATGRHLFGTSNS
jgi:hypothetical protein